jgi:hypothetical protein
MHKSTGLAIWGKVVVLCIMKGRDRGRFLPFPAPFTEPSANQGCGREAHAG